MLSLKGKSSNSGSGVFLNPMRNSLQTKSTSVDWVPAGEAHQPMTPRALIIVARGGSPKKKTPWNPGNSKPWNQGIFSVFRHVFGVFGNSATEILESWWKTWFQWCMQAILERFFYLFEGHYILYIKIVFPLTWMVFHCDLTCEYTEARTEHFRWLDILGRFCLEFHGISATILGIQWIHNQQTSRNTLVSNDNKPVRITGISVLQILPFNQLLGKQASGWHTKKTRLPWLNGLLL